MPRKIIVLKFGSSVLQSRADLPQAVHEIYRWIRRQYSVVAVVSAFAGETDRLLETVEEYRGANVEAIARIVATGEEVATAFLALELDRFGIPAQVLDPGQIQLIAETSSNSNDTEPVSADTAVIEQVLAQGKVAVVPGFVARDRDGRVALFGGGGSDLSALFLAKQLNARCRLIKDVEGIYNSDPALCPDAQRFAEITYCDALWVGGKIVQQKATEFARKTGVQFEVAALGANHATTVGGHHSTLAARAGLQRPLRVGLLGLGTVGLGVFQELWKHPQLFEVSGIAVRRPDHHAQHAPRHLLTRDCWDVIDDVDVVVELIGGSEPAGDLVNAALNAGIPVVTANKLLLAENADAAEPRRTSLLRRGWGRSTRARSCPGAGRRRVHCRPLRGPERHLQLHPGPTGRGMLVGTGGRRSPDQRIRRAGPTRRFVRCRHRVQAAAAGAQRFSRGRDSFR